MSDVLDLSHASRDELIELVVAQRERIADLERQVRWRENGHNGYVGGTLGHLLDPHAPLLHPRRPRPGMLEAALGTAFSGVLVSDFFAASTTYDGARHQTC